MEKLAEKIKNVICANNPNLTIQQAATIKFGLECALNEAIKTIAYFIIFAIFSLEVYYLIALAFFWITRIFAGGYHANTFTACFIVTLSILTIGILTGSQLEVPSVIRIILLLTSIVLAWIFAPVDHPNKPIIDFKRRKRFKYLSVAVFTIMAGITFILDKGVGATAVTILFLEALSLPAGEIEKRRISI